MKKESRGFTLIELLVVIAIIALLSSIILASLNTARGKGRNAKRENDIHQYQLAFELYYDKYGKYPSATTPTSYSCLGLDSAGSCWTGWNGDDQLLSQTNQFLPSSPIGDSVGDPNTTGYIYECTSAACSSYVLKWNLESLNQKCNNGALSGNSANHTICTYTSR